MYTCQCTRSRVCTRTDGHTASHVLPHACERSCTHTLTLVNTLAHTRVNLRSAHPLRVPPPVLAPVSSWRRCSFQHPPRGRQQHPGAPGRAEWGRQGQPVLGPRAARRLPLSGEGLGSVGWFQTQTGPLCTQTGPPPHVPLQVGHPGAISLSTSSQTRECLITRP